MKRIQLNQVKLNSKPNNLSNEESPKVRAGYFMVAVGAIIEHVETGKILLLKRLDNFHFGHWEPVYGRIDQGENLSTALLREVREETGLTEITIFDRISDWHMFRGEEIEKNEVIGITFACQTSQLDIQISSEHSEYRWVELSKAIEMVQVEGIAKDLRSYQFWQHRRREISQLEDKATRALADYQNLLRRQREERINLGRQANNELLSSLLESLDHLQMATLQICDSGLNLVVKNLFDLLKNQGLEVIDPLDQKFSVETMEAVDKQGSGQIVKKVVSRGYRNNGQMLRYAKVVVG